MRLLTVFPCLGSSAAAGFAEGCSAFSGMTSESRFPYQFGRAAAMVKLKTADSHAAVTSRFMMTQLDAGSASIRRRGCATDSIDGLDDQSSIIDVDSDALTDGETRAF